MEKILNIDKTCVILGAGSKIGAAVAEKFIESNYKIAIGARKKTTLESLIEKIGKNSDKILAIETDATKEKEVEVFVKRSESELGPIDVAIYNVSGFTKKSIFELTGNDIEEAWRRTCLGAFYFGKNVAVKMQQRKKGTIIFTGATAGKRGGKNFSAFAIGKFGLRALSQSMARELNPEGIHTVYVNIDGIVKGSTSEDSNEKDDVFLNPKEIAETYFHLHRQQKSAWTQEIDLRPWLESF